MTAVGTAFGEGLAVGADVVAAAEEAATLALAGLGSAIGSQVLGAVFVCAQDPDLAGAALERAAAVVGSPHSVGCTAGGVFAGGRAVEGGEAVAVLAVAAPRATVRTFHLEVMRTAQEVAVVGVPERRGDERVAVLLSDPWSFPVDGFVSRINDTMPGLGLVGGLAGGVGGPGSTRLLVDGVVRDRGAAGVLLGGDVDLRTVVSQGCRPVGPAMVVTGSEGQRLLTLAGVGALAKLEQVLAGLPPEDQALATRGLQLGVARDEYADAHDHGDFLVRAVLGADRERGALLVPDEVAVGQTVRFHVRDAEAADRDLRDLLARSLGDRSVLGGLLFSCNGRGAAFFADSLGSAAHDAAVTREVLGGPAVAGFFAGGELGPLGGRNYLHTFTASLLAFGGSR